MSDQIIKPRVLKGFRDSLPQDEIPRRHLISRLTTLFESFAYVPIDTPALEYTEVLLGKGGGETDKQVYRFEDNGGRDIALRFDLTVPFARFMAQHKEELTRPFRRYHIDKVWRGENTQKGRYREFIQCDFDLVGVDSAAADFEILLMITRALQALEIGGFQVRLSHRGLFNRLLTVLGIEEHSVEVLRTVDKLRKIGREKVTDLLTELTGNAEATETVLAFIEAEGAPEEVLAAMEAATGGAGEESGRLRELMAMAKETGIAGQLLIDPSITRGLDYYTGVVYETFLTDLPGIGSVCSGGRYNNLAALYSKEPLPGVGASVGLDRLLAALAELGRINRQGGAADVLVINMDEKLQGHYQKIADEMRRSGVRVEVYPETKKMGPQFKLAESRGITAALICGSDEAARGVVTIKDLQKRENLNDLTLQKAVDAVRGISSSPAK